MNIRLILLILLAVVSTSLITVLFIGSTNSGKLINTFNLPCSISYQAGIPTLKLNKSSSELPQELVFFLKSNSTGHICIRYTSKSTLNDTLQIVTIPYVSQIEPGFQQNRPTTDITVIASPDTINPDKIGTDTIVMYTITAGNSNGVYRLPVSFICSSFNEIPIIVWSHKQEVNPSDIKMWFGAEHGGVCKSPIDSAQIVGFDGGSLEYHEITPIGW